MKIQVVMSIDRSGHHLPALEIENTGMELRGKEYRSWCARLEARYLIDVVTLDEKHDDWLVDRWPLMHGLVLGGWKLMHYGMLKVDEMCVGMLMDLSNGM